jgi:hypothetical protein
VRPASGLRPFFTEVADTAPSPPSSSLPDRKKIVENTGYEKNQCVKKYKKLFKNIIGNKINIFM